MDLPSSATPRTGSATDVLSIHPDSVRVSANAAAGEFARHLADNDRMSDPARRDDRSAERRERSASSDRSRRDDVRERDRERDPAARETKAKETSIDEGGEATPESGIVGDIAATAENDASQAETSDSKDTVPAQESGDEVADEATTPEADLAPETTRTGNNEGLQMAAAEETAETTAVPALESDEISAEASTDAGKAATPVPAIAPVQPAQTKAGAQSASNGETPQTAAGTKQPVDTPRPQTAAPLRAATDVGATDPALDAEAVTTPATAAAAKPVKGLGQEAAEALANKKADAKRSASAANAAPQATTPPQATRGASAVPQAPLLDVAQTDLRPASRSLELPSGIQPAANTATVRIGTLPGQSQPTQIPAMAIALQIARNLQKGINRFDIRLDPPEMGRVDVRMEVRRDGHVTAHLTVEKPETLELLQRDARALQQALNNAGLDADENSLNFSLHDQNADEDRRNAAGGDRDSVGVDEAEAATAPIYNVNLSATGGIDIRV